MNIIEAVKTGKNARRKGWSGYRSFNISDPVRLTREDVLANDWEIEETKVFLSKEQIKDAMRFNYSFDGIDFEKFWEDLGFPPEEK